MEIKDSKTIWCKIRYYQQLYGISNDLLAKSLNVQPRTLKNYDKNAQHLTIGQIEGFLGENKLTIEELLS